MTMNFKNIISFICFILFFIIVSQGWAESKKPNFWITEEEAALPERKILKAKKERLPRTDLAYPVSDESMAGPIINVEKPSQKKTYSDLIDVVIHFTKNPFGEPVDMKSLKVILLKLWDIDLTDRVRSFIKGTDIEASGLKFPEGEHEIEIRIKDQEEMETTMVFKVKVG